MPRLSCTLALRGHARSAAAKSESSVDHATFRAHARAHAHVNAARANDPDAAARHRARRDLDARRSDRKQADALDALDPAVPECVASVAIRVTASARRTHAPSAGA